MWWLSSVQLFKPKADSVIWGEKHAVSPVLRGGLRAFEGLLRGDSVSFSWVLSFSVRLFPS